MAPKVDPESLSKLKRKRGQLRFRARRAYTGLKSRVEDLASEDISSVELWQISSLESEVQAVEIRVEAYAEAHMEVQCLCGDDLST